MKILFALILVTFFVCPLFVCSLANAQDSDSRFPLFTTAEAAQHHCPFDTVVWLNTKTDSYNLGTPSKDTPATTGAYMCQREADQMDYHLVPKAQ